MLFVSQEIAPYLASGPQADFCRLLAQDIQEKGAEVRSFMPRYGAINERRNQLHEVIRLSGMNIIIDDTDHPLIIKVATLQPTRLQVYFIDNDDFFYRHSPGKLETVDSAHENDERAMFFVRGTVETVKKLRWEADVVQCVGWITALTPLYLKAVYADDPAFRNAKIVYTLTDDTFADAFDARFTEKLLQDGVNADNLKTIVAGEAPVDYITLNRLAIDYADAIVVQGGNVAPDLVEYAKASGKPVLLNEDAGTFATYRDFYTTL